MATTGQNSMAAHERWPAVRGPRLGPAPVLSGGEGLTLPPGGGRRAQLVSTENRAQRVSTSITRCREFSCEASRHDDRS